MAVAGLADAGIFFPADAVGTLSLSDMDEIPVHYDGAYADSYDPAFDDVGYVSSFDDQSDFSTYEDPRVYSDWDDWCDTDVPDDSVDLPPKIIQRILILARDWIFWIPPLSGSHYV